MSPIRHFDHVGITVRDLDTVTAFFVGLGFETEGRTVLEGAFLDTVIGIPDSRTEIVMLRPPDGGTGLELSSFIRPGHEPGSPDPMPNELGLRNMTFEVSALSAMIRVICAASALGARGRTSCKRQASGSNPLTGSQLSQGKYPLCAALT
jgi:catechol 2,3-dioxygenase-like lactoylglutathione lyase family enzyme